MTKIEFGRLYKSLEAAYGSRSNSDDHCELWWKKFGNWPCHLFAQAVDTVLDSHRAFGSDKWPTPGDFNYIVSQNLPHGKNNEPDTSSGKTDQERQYMKIQWRIRQLPIETRNSLLRKAVNLIHTKNVPDYMKSACDCEQLMNPLLENLKVRIFCQKEGIPFPLQGRKTNND